MNNKVIAEYKIKKVSNNIPEDFNDLVINEQPLTIFVNGYELVTLMTLPDMLKELRETWQQAANKLKNERKERSQGISVEG